MAFVTDETRAVVIAGSGQRCGSTLLQRLLSSSGEIFMWGEHGGYLRYVSDLVDAATAWEAMHGAASWADFGRLRWSSFMANLAPRSSVVRAAARGFITTCFSAELPTGDSRRWGFKEVRYTADDCVRLQAVLGELRVIHLTRRPEGVLTSLDAWERESGEWQRSNTLAALALWEKVNSSFSPAGPDRSKLSVLTVTYEDLLQRPDETLDLVCEHAGISTAAVDHGHLSVRVHASGQWGQGDRPLRSFDELPTDLREQAELLLDGPAGWPWRERM